MRNSSSFSPDENSVGKPQFGGINYKGAATKKILLALSIIAVGLAGRSALDKLLALRGGAELVALWAQLSSVIELVAAVALAGVGAGLSVLVAQTASPERHQLFLRRALRLGLAVSLPVGVVAALFGLGFSDLVGGAALSSQSLVLAALAGWIAVVPGLVNSLWVGQQHRDRMLALAVASAAMSLAAAVLAPRTWLLELIILAHAAPALVILLIPTRRAAPERTHDRVLEHYILPGLAIGILGPVSLLIARSVVADALSWHDSGVLQALWRISDWVCGFAAGVLSVIYLPKLAAATPAPGIGPVLREAAKTVLLPSALAFVVLFAGAQPLLAALYEPSFEASHVAIALLFAGNVVRIASWIPLFGLYAALRTRAIAIGELLSLPLFALLVFAMRERLTLELVGGLWLATYVAYAAFNFWALRTQMTNRFAATIVAARK